MRLDVLDNGHRRGQRILLALAKLTSPDRVVPGPMAIMTYRRRFFGRHMAGCLQEAMREANHWSIPELELMAAFVSNVNGCEPCAVDHTAAASTGFGDWQRQQSVLEDWRAAELDDRLKATLGFLEIVSLTPDKVGPDDIVSLRTAGVSDEAIAEALYVCFVFDTINRFAGAFDMPVPSEAQAKRTARFLGRFGYRFASLPG